MTFSEAVSEKMAQGVKATPPWVIMGVLMMIGVGSGGAGHLVYDNIFADETARAEISATQEEITDLSLSIRELNRTIMAQAEIVNRTRCEVEALREGFNWLDYCWGPNPPGMRTPQ